MWKIVENALMCFQPHGHMRPSISEVVKKVHDTILIERENNGISDDMSITSVHSSLNFGSLGMAGEAENFFSLDYSIARPIAR